MGDLGKEGSPLSRDVFFLLFLQWGFRAPLIRLGDGSLLLGVGAFLLTALAFLLALGAFFAYSGRLIRALRDCKPRSLTVSKEAPTVSKKASPKQYPNGTEPRLAETWPPTIHSSQKLLRN